MTNLERAKDLYDLIFSGKLMEGFEKYYHEDVVMQEIGEAPRTGKASNREHELQFVGGIGEVHGANIESMASNEETGHVFIENWMDMTHNQYGRSKMEQVCVQVWKDGQIIKETFFHK